MQRQTISIPTRGPCEARVFYSISTVALHLMGPDDKRPLKSNMLVEASREGCEGIANAQAIRAMANASEMFDLVVAYARQGPTPALLARARELDNLITG